MSTLKNDTFIRALLRQPVPYTPIWIMRQAGRYLPEYRKIRKQAGDFLTLCKTPELACEVTLQPIKRFDLDAAIIFSDILTIPDAMGLGLYFEPGEGPKFKTPVRTEQHINQLEKPKVSETLSYVTDAIKLTQQALAGQVPLIGFSGSPWTLACYMIEGGSSKQFSKIKAMMYQAPALLKQLLSVLTSAVIDYVQAQIAAGVDAVMIFDSWGGVLTPETYQQFSLANLQAIQQGVSWVGPRGQRIPNIMFSKGVHHCLPQIATSGFDAMGVDWTIDLGEVRKTVADQISLQGNLDPGVLYAEPDTIKQAVQTTLQSYGPGSGHVFNLGHGIWPDCPPESVAYLIETVHELSRAYHQ